MKFDFNVLNVSDAHVDFKCSFLCMAVVVNDVLLNPAHYKRNHKLRHSSIKEN